MAKKSKLSNFLTGKEWYDYTGTKLIKNCPRKALFNQILRMGMGVGPGADFGTCFHAATATYYYWWGKLTERDRRVKGWRAFKTLHQKIFSGPLRDSIDYKHSEENGLAAFDHYCDVHLPEDSLLRPVEVELAGAIQIKPYEGEPEFKPFWYAFRIDGIHQRMRYGDYWVREMKTTSGGVKREMVRLKVGHQPRGYVWIARQYTDSPPVTGVIPDIVSVAAKTREVARDFFHKSIADGEAWRSQLIHTVNEWRLRCERGIHKLDFDANGRITAFDVDLDLFYQNDQECTNYGMCAFYDLCDRGINPETMRNFGINDWNPLANAAEDEVNNSIQTVEIDDGKIGIKESLKCNTQ